MLTPIGVFIYNVLAMGLTNANDIFEQCLLDILHGLHGVFNIADDILAGYQPKTFKTFISLRKLFKNLCLT